MPSTDTRTRAVTRPASRWTLSPNVSLYLLVSIVISLLAGSSAPTPLYSVYQSEWGFTPITTTIVFGIYAIAVLIALLVAGKLSDHIGRKPVILAALAVQILTMIVFVYAAGVPELILGRVVQGLSTGAVIGALGAAMLDRNKERGALLNSIAPATGTATGALVSGLFIQFLPAPTELIYWALLAIFALQMVAVIFMTETVSRKAGALASMRPEIGLPKAVRRQALIAAPVLFAVWSLAGLYGSLGPALIRHVTGSDSLVLGGLGLFALAGSGVATTLLLRNVAPTRIMISGILLVIVGVAITLVSIEIISATGFFVGTVIAGAGFGSGFQGSIRTVVPQTEPHERAGVLSLLYVVSYLGMGVPAVIAGFLVVHAGGLYVTATEYGVAVMVLSGFALIGLLRTSETE